ncbi:MAG: aldehyde dehydrogenase family protein [bacterium]|nr:aldehyde dehydrogenase family protein [bacterium]
MILKDINPATEEVIVELPLMDVSEASAVVERARQGFSVWSLVPLEKRLAVLSLFPEKLRAAREEVSELITKEMGRPIKEARAGVDKAVEACEFILDHAAQYLASEISELDAGLKNELEFIPMGVVLAISPWNYPVQLSLYEILPALICGNAVIHKPSRVTPLIGLKLQTLFDEILAPYVREDTKILQTIIATSEVAQKIIEDKIEMVALIGSTEAGRDIMRRASGRLLNVALELGGKDAFVVLEDANINETVKAAVSGAVKNAGQACNAVERIYVPASLKDEFVRLAIEEVKKIKVGNPIDETVTMGPLALSAQRDTVEAHVADALAKGAKLEYGGKRISGAGYFFEPTVLSGVNHTMDVMTKETFGPVIAIQAYRDVEEAIALANDIAYGLTASVWTRDIEQGKEIARRLHAGCVGVNHLCRSHPGAPWGGVRESGVGRMLGKGGMRAFCEARNLRWL